ncbi:low-density lipoprotein receptor-related protein 3 [Trichonephila clavipes]|nr:low-density lipoprotein receptor-related protein 3 [Trichonephila clavipes]
MARGEDQTYLFQLSNARAWLLDHLTPSPPVPTEDVIRRAFIESSTLEQLVAIPSGIAAEEVGLISSHAKPLEIYFQSFSPGASGLGFPMAFQNSSCFWVMAVYLLMYEDLMLFALLRVKGTSG